MRKATKADILWFVLPLIVALCFGIWYIKTDPGAELTVHSDIAQWDLRGVDMAQHYVRLRGGVADFVPNALLEPDAFNASDLIQTGVPKNAAEYYTARIRLLVPDGRPYAITLSSVDYADAVYINDHHMQTIGQPGDSGETSVPQTATLYYTVEPVDGVIEVVHQASNFVHREGGNPAGLRIGSIESVSRYHARQTLGSALVMGGCLFLFLVHIVLFLLLRSYRTNLYFALFCLVWFLRIGVTDAKVLTAVFPDISWYLTFRIEYMAIPLACLLLSLALDAMFEGLIQQPVKWAIALVNIAAALLFLFMPTVWMTQALPFVYATILIIASYILVRFIMRLGRDQSTEQRIVLSALVVFVYAAIREMLYHNNILIFPVVYSGMLDFSSLVFILFQMTASFLGTMREVAEAREREQRLALENAALDRVNRLKTDLMTTVSHELRTPLAVMMGYAELVAKEMRLQGTETQATEDVEAIALEAQRMARIVEEMQDVSVSRAFDRHDEAVALDAIIRQLARLYAPILERKHNQLTLHIEEELPQVAGNADEITQVLFNLLSNAGKHTENGEVSITASRWNEGAQVTVTDTGRGIPAALLPRAFERGVTGEDGGNGLGLSICRDIITASEGHISIQSEEGKGTAVTFTLPAKGGQAPAR